MLYLLYYVRGPCTKLQTLDLDSKQEDVLALCVSTYIITVIYAHSDSRIPRLAGITASEGHLFIAQFIDTYSQLRLWYLELSYSQSSCSFEKRAAKPGELPFIADFPQLNDTFPEVIIFPEQMSANFFFRAGQASL